MIQILNEPAEIRTVLENVRWETYIELAEQRRGSIPRMTYDEGMLELMSPKRIHERLSRLIGRLVETFSEVHQIEIQSVASTTFRRADLAKGYEADESYYIQHADQVRDKDILDLAFDPPPDLVIEVEITSSAIEKMPLFAAMGISEVWRHDGERFTMSRMVRGHYQEMEESDCLPGLTVAMIDAVLALRNQVGETALISGFRKSLDQGDG